MPPIPSEILRQVKGIAIRTRGLVDTLLTAQYRSVFRGQGMEFAEVRGYQPGDDYPEAPWRAFSLAAALAALVVWAVDVGRPDWVTPAALLAQALAILRLDSRRLT